MLEDMIAELTLQRDHATSVAERREIQNQIDELEMQYEDEDGELQWL